MHNDRYTKTILTIIALLLAAIAAKPILEPLPALAQSPSPLSTIQVSFGWSTGNMAFFDTRTGEIWGYSEDGKRMDRIATLVELGKPLKK